MADGLSAVWFALRRELLPSSSLDDLMDDDGDELQDEALRHGVQALGQVSSAFMMPFLFDARWS